jgi:hypothetical protein
MNEVRTCATGRHGRTVAARSGLSSVRPTPTSVFSLFVLAWTAGQERGQDGQDGQAWQATGLVFWFLACHQRPRRPPNRSLLSLNTHTLNVVCHGARKTRWCHVLHCGTQPGSPMRRYCHRSMTALPSIRPWLTSDWRPPPTPTPNCRRSVL